MTAPVNTAKAARRALIWMLLETHSPLDVHAMLQRTLSGGEVTLEQVRAVRKAMLKQGSKARPKNVSLKHLRYELSMVPPVTIAPPRRQPRETQVPRRPVRTGPETFESQMSRIAAGASLMPAPDFRTPDPAFTLGGVASALL